MSWLTDTLFATGALIALVLVLRRPAARWFGPGMAYALWALPLLRLVLPPLVLPEESAPADTMIVLVDEVAAPVHAPAALPGWPLAELAVALWLTGAIGFLVWRVVAYRRMRRTLLAEARPVGEAGSIRMVESAAVAAPVAFGLRDRVIALPPGFMASEDRTARDLAIAHELEHHAGRDVAVNFAMQPLLALHWFNPLAWLGWRALRRDQEAACDARVLAGRCAATRAAYARLIADYAQGQRLALAAPLACPVVGEKSIIYRLRSLTMEQPTPGRRRFGRLLIGAAALALPLTATITYAASKPAPPAPPAPPAAPAAVEAPAAPGEKRMVKKYVIIDNPAGSTVDDQSLHTRVIERNGRTIVIKTPAPISDQEAEARVAKAEASMAEAEKMAGAHGAIAVTTHGDVTAAPKVKKVVMVHRDGHPGAVAPAAPGEHHDRVVSIVTSDSQGEWTGKDGHATAIAMACKDGQTSEANATVDKDGKKQVVRMKICSSGHDLTKALDGLRKARERLATDSNLSAEVREEVLRELDEEIARLAKDGQS